MALQRLLRFVGFIEEPNKREKLTDLLNAMASTRAAVDGVLELAQTGVVLPWSDILNLAIATNSPQLLIRLKNDNEMWLKRVQIEFPGTFEAAYMPSLPFKMRHTIFTSLVDRLKFGSTRFSDHSDQNPTARVSVWYLLYQDHMRKLRILQKNGVTIDKSFMSMTPQTLSGSFSNIFVRNYPSGRKTVYDTGTGVVKISDWIGRQISRKALMEFRVLRIIRSRALFNPGNVPQDIVDRLEKLSTAQLLTLYADIPKRQNLATIQVPPFEQARYLLGMKPLEELNKVAGKPSVSGYYDCEKRIYQDLRGKKFKLENCPGESEDFAFSVDPGEPYKLISFWRVTESGNRQKFDPNDFVFNPDEVFRMEDTDFVIQAPVTYINGWLTYRQKRNSFFGGYDIKASHVRSLGEAILRGDWRKHTQIMISARSGFATAFCDRGLDFGFLTFDSINTIELEYQELIGCSLCTIPTEKACEKCNDRFCDELCAVGHTCST